MSEVCSAGNPHHADRVKTGIDCNRTNILRSTKATLNSDLSFFPICLNSIGLAYGELQLGHPGDRVKASSYCTSTARGLAPRAGLLDTVCRGPRRRRRIGRSGNDQDFWHFDRIATGRCKCSLSRLAATREDGGNVQMTLPVLTDAHEE
jgi:hypothetical protein